MTTSAPDELDGLEDEEEGYCYACETNPRKLEQALEEAAELPAQWRKLARAMPAESVTAKILRACAKELSVALAARCEDES